MIIQTIRIVLELLVAAFAVLGLYGTVCILCQRLFSRRRTVLAVKILTQRDAESAELLIRDALSHSMALPLESPLVLTTWELRDHPTLVRALKRYGLACWVTVGSEEQSEGNK